MDSLTQIVLGAAVAEAVAGKKMGNKAAFWGAVAGTLPDLDVLLNSLYHPIDAALVHRGVSHSIFFSLVVGPLLGWIFFKLYKERYELKTWIWLWFLAIITHPILDMFTNYGTQFFWPFEARITFNSVFVIDPLYTIPFMICLLVALFLKKESKARAKWNRGGLIYSSLYLFYGVVVKLIILSNTHAYFAESKLETSNAMVTPMPLTSFYWMMLVEDDKNYYYGYKSLFYPFQANDIDTVAKNKKALDDVKWPGINYGERLKFISKGYYTTELEDNRLVFYDLRFGNTSKMSNGSIKKPLMGFGMVIDNGNVQKTEVFRATGLMKQINFGAYVHKVFYK